MLRVQGEGSLPVWLVIIEVTLEFNLDFLIVDHFSHDEVSVPLSFVVFYLAGVRTEVRLVEFGFKLPLAMKLILDSLWWSILAYTLLAFFREEISWNNYFACIHYGLVFVHQLLVYTALLT